MEKALYAEIYLICILIVGLLLFWTSRRETRSVSERWLIRLLLSFLCNFLANFFFTIFNALLAASPLQVPVAYAFKTLYFVTLAVGVFAWCCYSEAEVQSETTRNRHSFLLLALSLVVPFLVSAANLFTHHMFHIDEQGGYHRHELFHFQMLYLIFWSLVLSIRLMNHARFEIDPTKKAFLHTTAAFPLCILGAWLLSFIGEGVPVICVALMFALLFIYIGTNDQQISKDKLTQVNNRQNLIGFLNYKIINHEEKLFLMMIDIDFFKKINDNYGHLEGDRALVYVSSVLKKSCANFKKRPYIARYGGDEFMIVLEGTREDAGVLCGRIRGLLAEHPLEDAPYRMTLSIGLAEFQAGMDAKGLIAAADAEMYKVKQRRE